MKYGADRKHKPRLAQAWPLDELTYSPLSDPGEDARDGGPRCWAVAPAAPRETQPRAEITAALAGDAKRIQHDGGGALSVKLRSVRLGTRELKDLELPLRMSNHPTGGVFGARLLEAFDVTVDYERGVLAFSDCR